MDEGGLDAARRRGVEGARRMQYDIGRQKVAHRMFLCTHGASECMLLESGAARAYRRRPRRRSARNPMPQKTKAAGSGIPRTRERGSRRRQLSAASEEAV